MSEKKPGLVAVYASALEAEMAAERLAAVGITAKVVCDDCGGMRPHLAYSLGVKLKVAPEDEAQAKEVLEAAATPQGPSWTCTCGEAIEPGFDVCWKCGAEHSAEPIA